jgi:nucleoside-diphosphate-sugar epimerase
VDDPLNKVVRPHVNGTREVLLSADKARSVTRFVHVSSVAAVFNVDRPSGTIFTESDFNTWSSVENGDHYGYAKAEAEKLVREAGLRPESTYDVSCINPGYVFGRCYTKAHTKTSPYNVREVIYGNEQGNTFQITVHVKDVAVAAVRAMEVKEAGGERFILVGDGDECNFWTSEMGGKLNRLLPDYVFSSPVISGVKGWLYSWFMTPFQIHMTTKEFRFDNSKSKRVLKIEYHSGDVALRETALSMLETGEGGEKALVKGKKRQDS